MKRRKLLTLGLTSIMLIGALAGCGGGNASGGTEAAPSGEPAAESTEAAAGSTGLTYASVVLGETGTDLKATIKVLNHRTDMLQDNYPGTSWKDYLDTFHEMYPGIEVDIEGITDYASDSLLRLQGGDWGDIMMIPAVDSSQYADYFLPMGTLEEVSSLVRFTANSQYGGIVYGIPSTANAQGVLYNKKVFEAAGITELPKTGEEFIKDLKLIKEKTDAIPLYTNYAAGWTMGAWDAYIGGSATGDSAYMNQKLAHTANPFADPGNGTGAYNIYKVLYDAVAEGLTEDDYTTTDWEGCKGMINRGEIGSMVLGSWAYSQMQAAGDHPEDIGYMSFPITVNGKQYASAGPDYAFAINKDSSDDNKLASMIFIKWMTEESGFSYNEAGIPIATDDDKYPDLYAAFEGIDYVADDAALEGEEDLMSLLNADSELNFNSGGDKKVQAIVEHAANKDMSFDEIMNDWNAKWTDAQELNGVKILY